MSKIEDALNKVKLSNSKGLRILSPDNKDASNKNPNLNSASRIVSPNNLRASSLEISRMSEDDLFTPEELSELKIIFSDMPGNKIVDTYRDLRTKIVQKTNRKNVSIMVTSAETNYFSHMTAINLSVAFTFDESKTAILIDSNLNSPKISDALEIDVHSGLTDYLENENIGVEQILHKSGIKRLRVIPAGSSRAMVTEYFTSLKMRNLMSHLLSRYSDRYIFVDSAPIIDSADTRILADMCDYVLLVVPYGKVTKNRVKEAADKIDKDKLLGVIFADKPALPSKVLSINI